MSAPADTVSLDTSSNEGRARVTCGTSSDAVYALVARAVRARHPRRGGVLADVGCGTGALRAHVRDLVRSYAGIDLVRYDAFPEDCAFYSANLDVVPWPVDDQLFDLTACVETIEHLENPRALFRELLRITKPGGVIIVTTPNQLSLLSKLTLVLKNQFNAFQEKPGLYPAHRTALLESDLRRIARELGMLDVEISYSHHGRIPGTRLHWPAWRGVRGRAFSDNVMLVARVPGPGRIDRSS